MKQLVIFCEGPTEQGFCKQSLQPYLFPQHDGLILPLAVGTKNHRHVYGIGSYSHLRKFIQNTLKSRKQPEVRFTALLDLYALPDDFPGKAGRAKNPSDPTAYVAALEKALGEDIDDARFLPYLQLHEFETLLFADPDAFRIAFENCETEIATLKQIAASFPCIEHINDDWHTAPSKRVVALFPAYGMNKPGYGPDIAEYIGLAAIRAKCPHFHAWLQNLENAWPTQAGG